jgi:hypothetical protein
MQQLTTQRSLGELFGELAQNTGTLVRKEVELVSAEMTAKAKVAGREVAFVASGGALTMIGAIVLMAALILVLGTVMPLWASALLVGAVVTVVGGVVAALGIRGLKAIEAAPRQTMETLEENRQWIKEQMSR